MSKKNKHVPAETESSATTETTETSEDTQAAAVEAAVAAEVAAEEAEGNAEVAAEVADAEIAATTEGEAPAVKEPKPDKFIECPHCHTQVNLTQLLKGSGNGRARSFSEIRLLGTAEDRKPKIDKSANQLKAIVAILEGIEGPITEETVKAALEAKKEDLRTRQDPMRVFKYYRKELESLGIAEFIA